jgi:hypothetical protein
METEDHLKNGASPKSHASRNNAFRKCYHALLPLLFLSLMASGQSNKNFEKMIASSFVVWVDKDTPVFMVDCRANRWKVDVNKMKAFLSGREGLELNGWLIDEGTKLVSSFRFTSTDGEYNKQRGVDAMKPTPLVYSWKENSYRHVTPGGWVFFYKKYWLGDTYGYIGSRVSYCDGYEKLNDGHYFVIKYRIDKNEGNDEENFYYGLIDFTGKVIVTMDRGYKYFENFVNGSGAIVSRTIGLFQSQVYNSIGFINEKGEEIVPTIYNGTRLGNINGQDIILATNKEIKKMGIFAHDGKILVPFIYDELKFTYRGTFYACKDEKWGLIDPAGNILAPFVYKAIETLVHLAETSNYNGKILAVQAENGKWGLISGDTGKEIVSPRYDEYNLNLLRRNEDWFRINVTNGEIDNISENEKAMAAEKQRRAIDQQRRKRIAALKTGMRLWGRKMGEARSLRYAITGEVVAWNENKSRVYIRIVDTDTSITSDNVSINGERAWKDKHFWIDPFNEVDGWAWISGESPDSNEWPERVGWWK